MLKDKMSPSFYQTLPWRIASRKYDTGFYVIHGKDTPDRELQILKLHDSPHPIKEHLDRIENNAEAIVTAVNSTYGADINPEAIGDLLEAVEVALWATLNGEFEAQMQGKPRLTERCEMFRNAIQKAKLK